jgi:putative endonuclease
MLSGLTRRGRGQHAETIALHFLQKKRLRCITQNYQIKGGELDLIMMDKTTLVFVEVRYRKNNDFGGAVTSITPKKRRRLQHTAQYFLSTHPKYADNDCRFDVIALTGTLDSPTVEWLKNVIYGE